MPRIGKLKSQTFAEGRKCEICGAILSIWNSGKKCFSHKRSFIVPDSPKIKGYKDRGAVMHIQYYGSRVF